MKILVLQLLFIFAGSQMMAQTNRTATTSATGTFGGEISLPIIVTNKFNAEYPNIAPTWAMEGDNYAAQYRDANSNLAHVIVYDRYGKFVRKDSEIHKPEHPQGVCSYYSEHYPEVEFVLWESEDVAGNKTYYAKHEETTICFDKSGNFVSTKKQNKDMKKRTQKGK